MKILASLLISLVAFLTLNAFIPTAEEAEIYNSTVRLHVIANSDSERDQEVKLKVRDKVVEIISNSGASSKEEAILFIEQNRDKIKEEATKVLRADGIDDDVQVKLGYEDYPTRDYENFSLPAGNYTSVRVIIGDGEGKNWWCVLFPPLCTQGAISYDDEEYTDVGLTSDQYKLITGSSGEYKVKFKLLEIASGIFGFDY